MRFDERSLANIGVHITKSAVLGPSVRERVYDGLWKLVRPVSDVGEMGHSNVSRQLIAHAYPSGSKH